MKLFIQTLMATFVRVFLKTVISKQWVGLIISVLIGKSFTRIWDIIRISMWVNIQMLF